MSKGGSTATDYLPRIRQPITLSPGPAQNVIFIESQEEILQYSITDLQGKMWMNERGTGQLSTPSIQSLPSGMYSVCVQTNLGIGIGRFVKL